MPTARQLILPTVKKDPKLDRVFQTQTGPGWLGGDAHELHRAAPGWKRGLRLR